METKIKLNIKCNDPWFSFIKNGEKKVEGRKGKLKYKQLKQNDIVRFFCPESNQTFLAKVLKVDLYKNLTDYLNGVGLQNALPNIQSIEEGIKIYQQWNSEEEIKKMGFIAIWIEVL